MKKLFLKKQKQSTLHKKLDTIVKNKQNKNNRTGNQAIFNKVSLIILATGIVLIAISLGIFTENDRKSIITSDETPIVFSLATVNLAKEFACSCGSCAEKNLATCDCPTAISTKRFIEMNLKNGLPESEVTSLVTQVYGYYKG